MADQEKIKTLEQIEAMALWRKGKEAWNSWVKENPVYNVCFGGMDFSNVKGIGNRPVVFSGYIFPNGLVEFTHSKFGDGNVDFSDVIFGDGNVCFAGVDFGDGYTSFRGAEFGDGDVDFIGAEFGKGWVDFSGVKFGDGDVDFSGVKFGDEDVVFSGAEFGDGDVNFKGTEFGDGVVDFSGAEFGDGDINFRGANFSDGYVDFSEIELSYGEVDFSHARLKKSALYFQPYSEKNALIPLRSLDFSNMIIDGYLSLGEFQTDCVLDLTNTKIDQTVQLDKTKFGFQQTTNYSGFWPLRYKKAEDKNTSRCFRILKKYAEDAKDHERKLDFFANEIRSDYGYGLTGGKLNLYLLYDKVSDYGRSFTRPTIGLLCSTLVFFSIYLGVSLTHSIHKTSIFFSSNTINAAQSNWGHALVLAAAHTVPFSFGSRAASSQAMTYLFNESSDVTTIWIYGLSIIQGVISTIFLFLMGLALRNFFRS